MQKRVQPLLAVTLSTLLLGIFFRFYHLDYKVYGHDEVYTSIRATGQNSSEIGDHLKQGIFRAGELLQYQQLNPEHGWHDTWVALQHHPEHPPLYYLGTRLWMEWFGSSIAITRNFAAVISLLAFPCLYWLCWELFQSHRVSSVAIALFAVSPFQVLYAQEARQYSLWTVMVLLSSAVLLWTRRVPTPKKWIAYSMSLVLGLYTSLFFVITLLSHGLYIVVIDRVHRNIFRCYAIATSIALFSFIPWIIIIFRYQSELQAQTTWLKMPTPLHVLAKLWGLHISSGFVDLGLPLEHPYTYLIPPLFIGLVVVASWMVCRKTPKQVWLFILLPIGINITLLIAPDLLMGGLRSASSRYYVPTYIGVQLLVADWIAHWLAHPKAGMQRVGRLMFAGLLILGVVSCTISAQTHTWWNKGIGYSHLATAQIVNQVKHPLIWLSITGDTLGNTISLSYLLHPDVALQLIQEPETPKIPGTACDIFLYYPSKLLTQHLQQTYAGQMEWVDLGNGLVRLQRTGIDCRL